MATKTTQVKLSASTHKRLTDLGAKDGLSFDDVVVKLLDFYESKSAVKVEKGDKGRTIHSVSKHDRITLFLDAIQAHNAKATAKKDTGLYPVFVRSSSFIAKETGLNAYRDVRPVYQEIEIDIAKEMAEQGITAGAMKAEVFKNKDEKGRLVYIGEILKEAGISHLYGRG